MLRRILQHEGSAFVKSLKQIHSICCGCEEEEYLNDCLSPILAILENVVCDRMIGECVECRRHVESVLAIRNH